MNPLLSDDISEEEMEMNTIIREDNIDQLKRKLVNHSFDSNFQDRNGISLIEKCIFFESKKCMKFLIEENVPIDRHKVQIDHLTKFEIGLMEYGALKGNKNIIKICLEKDQKIQNITIKLGLIAHQNELVEWMIKEGKQKKHFNERIEADLLGIADNIEFNEKILGNGINVNVNFYRLI